MSTLRHTFASYAARRSVYGLVLLLPLSAFHSLLPPVAPQVLGIYVTPGLYLTDLAIAGLFLTSLLPALRRVRRTPLSPLTALLSLLVVLAVLSLPTALSPLLAAYTAGRWLVALGVYLCLAYGLGEWLELESLVGVFLAGLAIQVLVGLGQVLRQGPLGLPGELALPVHQPGAAIIPIGSSPWLRAYGLTFHPNVFGGYLAVGLILGLPWLTKPGRALVWCWLWLGLLLSFSRSAWLAVIISLPLVAGWLCWRRPDTRRVLAMTLFGVGLVTALWAALLTRPLMVRVQETAWGVDSPASPDSANLMQAGQTPEVQAPRMDPAMRERLAAVPTALSILANRPILGVGAGNFPVAVLRMDETATLEPIHNVPLLLATEVGVLGGGIWLWLCLFPVANSLKAVLQIHTVEQKTITGSAWPVILLAAWFALAVISQWDDYPWALETGRLLGAVVLGLLSAAR